MYRKLLMILVAVFIPAMAFGQVSDDGKPVQPVTDADIVGHTHWSNDTVWNIQGKVYVEDGEVLTIEPGTIVKADTGSGLASSALVVARGGKIYAEGTQCNPIIFTSILDDTDDAFDLPLPPDPNGRGLWGGVIVLGRATIADPAGENDIEGLAVGDPRNLYGGADDNDNSGVLRFISIRHGGAVIGTANEINGLTLGAVGRGTVVDGVEIYMNIDDGIEFFGGTVNVKHVVSAFVGDDDMDYDEGFRGAGQFVLTIKDTLDSDSQGEHDGAVSPEDALPFATPLWSNVTGIGAGNTSASINGEAYNIRDNAGAGYFNSIIAYTKGFGVEVEDLASGADSRERLSVGDIRFQNNVWWEILGGLNDPAQTWVADSIFGASFDNVESDPGITPDWGPNGVFDPRPTNAIATGGWIDPIAAYNPPANPGLGVFWSEWIETVDYKGAFDPNAPLWTNDWTFLDFAGFFVDETLADCNCQPEEQSLPVQAVTDADIVGFTTWSRDTVWNIQGKVYVEAGDTLLIEPGTLVKADTGSGLASSALVVARGGYILALGDNCCPIVFTSIEDNVSDPFDLPLPPDPNGRGLWGGVLVLGNATIADPAGENDIEGLAVGDPRNLYGGIDDNDNSGVLNYISIRHGGAVIGTANEINGLTLGGVGRGTVIEGVEIYMNIDDGIEFFGGTVNVKYVVSAFVGDDDMDYDEGFRGSGQFVFTIKDTLDSDSHGEHDGAVSPEDATPYATPAWSNVTGIGVVAQGDVGASINGEALNIRDNAGGAYFNSIFAHHKGFGIEIEDLASGADSRERLSVGDLYFENNIFFNILGGVNDPAQTWVADSVFGIAARNNVELDPQFGCLNYGPVDSLDPRPDLGSPAVGMWVDPIANFNPPANPGISAGWSFDAVSYMGAFDPNLSMSEQWTAGWTFLDCAGWFADCRTTPPACCVGLRGNADGDASDIVDVGDLTYLIGFLFLGGPAPDCPEEGNVDGTGATDVGDLTALIGFLFLGGDAPTACP